MLLLTEDEIRKLKPLDGGNGSSGRCYHYKNDEVIKLLKYKLSFIIDNIKSLKGLKIDDVSFPIDNTDPRKNYFAYSLPFIEGKRLCDLEKKILIKELDLSLNEVSTIYNSTKEKVIKAANMGIKVTDVNLSNILVKDNLKTGLVDVDLWVKNNDINNRNNNVTH